MKQNLFLKKTLNINVSTRKLIGTVVLLAWIVFYIGLAAVVAVKYLGSNVFVELVFYAVAGIAWAFPARYLIVWMSRPDPEDELEDSPDHSDLENPQP